MGPGSPTEQFIRKMQKRNNMCEPLIGKTRKIYEHQKGTFPSLYPEGFMKSDVASAVKGFNKEVCRCDELTIPKSSKCYWCRMIEKWFGDVIKDV